MSNVNEAKKEASRKMLGAFIPETLFWQFKKVAAERQEEMQEAIMHAVYLYLDIDRGVRKDGQK